MRVSIHCRFLATRPPAGSLDALEAAATNGTAGAIVVGASHPRPGDGELDDLHPQWSTSTPAALPGCRLRLSYLLEIDVPGYYTRVVPEHVKAVVIRREKYVVGRMDARLREAERKRKPLTVISQTSKALQARLSAQLSDHRESRVRGGHMVTRCRAAALYERRPPLDPNGNLAQPSKDRAQSPPPFTPCHLPHSQPAVSSNTRARCARQSQWAGEHGPILLWNPLHECTTHVESLHNEAKSTLAKTPQRRDVPITHHASLTAMTSYG
mgnify:CR=1 FL=1